MHATLPGRKFALIMEVGMMRDPQGGKGYDARTAITFLLAGLGLGALTTLLMSPRSRPVVLASTDGGEPLSGASLFT